MAQSLTHKRKTTVSTAGQVQDLGESSLTVNDPRRQPIAATIANLQTDKNVLCNIDVSQLKAYWLKAVGGAILIETNDGSSPDDSFTLPADQVISWDVNDPHACLFTIDVTSLKITNASGGSVDLLGETIEDSTT